MIFLSIFNAKVNKAVFIANFSQYSRKNVFFLFYFSLVIVYRNGYFILHLQSLPHLHNIQSRIFISSFYFLFRTFFFDYFDTQHVSGLLLMIFFCNILNTQITVQSLRMRGRTITFTSHTRRIRITISTKIGS